MLSTDLARIVLGASVLTFAAAADLRWRRAPDACWILLALAGAFLLAIDAFTEPSFVPQHAPALIAAGLVLVLALVGYMTGLIAGGADAKALASLAVLAPLPLESAWTLAWPSLFPLVLTTLVNALLAALFVPLALGAWNVSKGEIGGLRTFLGFKTSLTNVDERTLWPLERVDAEGRVVQALTPGGLPPGVFDPDALANAGRERIWVTPKVPFLVPLLGGFILAVLIGDPFTALLDQVVA